MNKNITKYLIIIFAYLAVLYPLWVWYSNRTLAFDNTIWINLFPAFGLAAFAILWLHVVSGVFEPWLRKHFDFDKFVHSTSILVLIFIILHPLLLLSQVNFNFNIIFQFNEAKYIWFAIIGWLLLITYDIGKVLQRYDFFVYHWRKILLISTVGFLLIFFHSLGVGSDLQSGPLRVVWIFYGTTAIISTIYTYIIKNMV